MLASWEIRGPRSDPLAHQRNHLVDLALWKRKPYRAIRPFAHAQVDDLKIPRGDHGLAIGKLRRAHGEAVDAGRKVAVGAERGDEGVGR